MDKVTGIGGIFIKAKNPKKLAAWYRDNLGVDFGENTYVNFKWINDSINVHGTTVLSFFKEETEYFNPSKSKCMLNFRVKDLHTLLRELNHKGVDVIDKTEYHSYGSFGWIMDPEGNKIELWEPKDETVIEENVKEQH
ncbi:MAG TPA: VOC family protein [Parafilimonas sp.]|nr:VOC family protein [Parafilimonas sp.]